MEVENIKINAIMNINERTRAANLELVRALITYYAPAEMSTILELALWKDEMGKFDHLIANVKNVCRVKRGED